MSTPPATPALLDARAWAEQYRDPLRAAAIGRELVAAAGGDPAAAARGHFHIAWGEGRWGDPAAAAHARAAFDICVEACPSDPPLQALQRDLQAQQLRRQRQFEASLALLGANLALAETSRPAHAHYVSVNAAAISCSALHRMDDALRHFHRAQSIAQASGDAALMANAAANLGGAHYDVANLEDALRFCSEAFELAARQGAQGAWVTAGINRLLVLNALASKDEIRALSAQLLESAPLMRADKRAKYATVFAEAARTLGEPARAQAFLAEADALRETGTAPALEWVAVQADLHLAAGRAEAARSLIEPLLRDGVELTEDNLPLNVLRLQQSAAQACEALGDPTAALAHLKAAARTQDALFGRSARAHRIALEVRHELATADALRRAAETERLALAALNRELDQANQAKSRFLAAASHDLRQPIHALGLQVAHLRALDAGGEAAAVVQRMERSVGSLTGMLDALLDISRMDAGIVLARRQPLALRPFLARLADEAQARAVGLGLRLRLRARADAHTDTDPALLDSLLRNLLDNALKYTPRGAVLLALRPRADHWLVQVKDSGIGIAPDEQALVFDEFYQVGNGERDRTQGLGLGLAIVRRLARLLDHPVALVSQPGRGTCFSVRLPRANAPPASPAAPVGLPAPRPLAVAVIEDDAAVRESLVALLRRWGHHVTAGVDADAVLASLVPGAQLDAVLADQRLCGPARGDHEVQRLCDRLGRALPALIITGDTAAQSLRALDAGALPWLSKPVQPSRLRAWLDSVAPTATKASTASDPW